MLNSSLVVEFPKLGIVPVIDLFISVGAVIFLSVFAQWGYQQYRFSSQWPIFNKAGLFDASKSKEIFQRDGQKLLFDGFVKSPKGYLVDTDLNRQLVLSPQYANEIRSDPRLDFMEVIHRVGNTSFQLHSGFVELTFGQDMLGHLPGFEVFRKNYSNTVDVVRQRLTQSLGLVTEDISEEMAVILHEQWSEETEWHEIEGKTTLLEIVARISSRVFLGQEICRNPKWQRITIDYTVNAFMAVLAVKRYPRFLHRFVHWFLPETRKLRAQVAEARSIIQPVIDQRAAAGWVHPGNASGKKYTDAIQWMHDLSNGKNFDFAIGQLGLSLAAIHTTTDLLTQVIYDLCRHPDIIQPLRDEIAAVLGADGWKRTALYKMKLMDSVIKESQRLKPAGLLSMRRYVTKDIMLQDGHLIPKGSSIGVSSHWSWDSSIFENPNEFDGYRFFKMAEDPKKEREAQFVSTSPQHLAFGHGSHACPGRFFAANELKIALTHILMKYDFKLCEDANPAFFCAGWTMQSNGTTKLLVRRRMEEIHLEELESSG